MLESRFVACPEAPCSLKLCAVLLRCCTKHSKNYPLRRRSRLCATQKRTTSTLACNCSSGIGCGQVLDVDPCSWRRKKLCIIFAHHVVRGLRNADFFVTAFADRVESNDEPLARRGVCAAVKVTRTVRVRMRNVPLGSIQRDHSRGAGQ
jgi:hypothetical protein